MKGLLTTSIPPQRETHENRGLSNQGMTEVGWFVMCLIIAASTCWVVNKVVSSGYAGRLNYKDSSGTEFSAEISPPKPEPSNE